MRCGNTQSSASTTSQTNSMVEDEVPYLQEPEPAIGVTGVLQRQAHTKRLSRHAGHHFSWHRDPEPVIKSAEVPRRNTSLPESWI